MNAAQAGSSDWLGLAQIGLDWLGQETPNEPSEDQFPLPAP